MEEVLNQAKGLDGSDSAQAEALYKKVAFAAFAEDEDAKVREQAILGLGALLAKQGRGGDIQTLLTDVRPFFGNLPKAKTAKIVRTLIEHLALVPGTDELQVRVCKDSVEWCKEEKRTFLKHRVQTKLASLLLQTSDFQGCLALLTDLLREVKKLDDKLLLVEIHLVESRVHHALRNLPRAKASLTSARTAANAVYCPPALQAQIDAQAGILHADDKDYKTAFSYFYEAFEGYSSIDEKQAVLNLKYMLLCKVMTNAAEEVSGIVDSKNALKFSGADVEAMKDIASAYKKRSLEDLQQTVAKYQNELKKDPVIDRHLTALYEGLLEQNLCRLIEPFSKVEVDHIAKLIALPRADVEIKLSQMILDKKFRGILDQGTGCLVSFKQTDDNDTYTAALDTIQSMSNVVDSLYARAAKLA